MKNYLVLFAVLFISVLSFAQSNDDIYYKPKTDTTIFVHTYYQSVSVYHRNVWVLYPYYTPYYCYYNCGRRIVRPDVYTRRNHQDIHPRANVVHSYGGYRSNNYGGGYHHHSGGRR
jgi:hypothetical protein